MKFYLVNSGAETPVNDVYEAAVRESLEGEQTLTFTVDSDYFSYITDSTTVKYSDEIYHIVSRTYSESGSLPLCRLECEHASYTLNISVSRGYEVSGTPQQILAQILSGSGYSVAAVDVSSIVDYSVHGNMYVRNAVYKLAALCGAEVLYSCTDAGNTVSLCNHRGNATPIVLTQTNAFHSLSYTKSNGRSDGEGIETFDLTLIERMNLAVGDEVRILYVPFGINRQTRIKAIEYNPYNPFSVTIEVGDYVPDIIDDMTERKEQASKTAAEVEKIASDYVKSADVDASVETYIASEAGTAKIVAACSGHFVTEDDLAGIVTETDIRAIIESEISETGGSIRQYIEGKQYITQTTADGIYTRQTELSSEIAQYVDTAAGTAKIVAACSATYQTKDAMAGYVAQTTLNTSIGSYIDGPTGKAKIVSACSGAYATAASVATISQEVSEQEASIALVVGASRLVNTSGAVNASIVVSAINGAASSVKIKADRIEMTGTTTFLTARDVGASGKSVIDGGRITTGKISADRIDVDMLMVTKVYSPDYKVLITGTMSALYIGCQSASETGVAQSYIRGYTKVTLGGSSYHVSVDVSGKAFAPNGSSWKLGTESYRWGYLYAERVVTDRLTLNGTLVEAILTEKNVNSIYAIGSTSRCVTLNSSNALVPDSSSGYSLGSSVYKWEDAYITGVHAGTGEFSTSLTATKLTPYSTSSYSACYLGASSAYWQYAYIGSNTVMLGSSSSSKVGFFGTTAAARKSVSKASTSSSVTASAVATTLNNLLTALAGYGLLTSS